MYSYLSHIVLFCCCTCSKKRHVKGSRPTKIDAHCLALRSLPPGTATDVFCHSYPGCCHSSIGHLWPAKTYPAVIASLGFHCSRMRSVANATYAACGHIVPSPSAPYEHKTLDPALCCAAIVRDIEYIEKKYSTWAMSSNDLAISLLHANWLA